MLNKNYNFSIQQINAFRKIYLKLSLDVWKWSGIKAKEKKKYRVRNGSRDSVWHVQLEDWGSKILPQIELKANSYSSDSSFCTNRLDSHNLLIYPTI